MKRNFNFFRRILLVSVLFFFTAFYLQAQKQNTFDIKQLPRLEVNSQTGNFNVKIESINVSTDVLAKNLGVWFGLNQDHTFELVSSETDELRITHNLYQHYYKGIKVMNDIVMIHEKNGKVNYVNGEIVTNFNGLKIGEPISRSQVETIAKNDMFNSDNIHFSELENVITKTIKNGKVGLYNTIMIRAFSIKPLQGYTYYIDNTSKEIINKISTIRKADTPSVSATLNKGNQSITVDSYGGGYRLKNNAKNIHTLDATNLTGEVTFTGEVVGATEYSNSTANFTSDAHKPAVEIHWGMEKAYDYYLNIHNRNSYDGSGAIIRNYYNVNYSLFDPNAPDGYGFNAAAIDEPSLNLTCMVYGNGNYPELPDLGRPFVTIDIAGHEYTHLIINRTSYGGLTYQGESGALNEAIADMLGVAIDYYTGVSPNWTIGEGIINPIYHSVIPYMRSMSNPNSGPAALEAQQPDTYQGTYWADPNNTSVDNGGVHINSGVGNYWFYLLSEGGSGTNDIGNAYNVSPITITKAEKIIYRALMSYLTANSGFIDAYNATQQAVEDLYGANSNEQLQNIKAWYAVGIGTGVLSVNELAQLEGQFNLYPNPVNNGTFTINSTFEDIATYSLFDISGKMIKNSEKINQGINNIDISGVQSGLYLMKISANNQLVTKKIVVN